MVSVPRAPGRTKRAWLSHQAALDETAQSLRRPQYDTTKKRCQSSPTGVVAVKYQ